MMMTIKKRDGNRHDDYESDHDDRGDDDKDDDGHDNYHNTVSPEMMIRWPPR